MKIQNLIPFCSVMGQNIQDASVCVGGWVWCGMDGCIHMDIHIYTSKYIYYIYISRYSIFILTSLCNNRRNKKIESLDTESISTLGGGENLFKKLLHKPKLFTLDIFYECSTDSRNNWVVPTRDRNKVWRSLSSGTPTLLKCSLREDRNGERIQVILIWWIWVISLLLKTHSQVKAAQKRISWE